MKKALMMTLIGMVGFLASHASAQLPTVSLDTLVDWKKPTDLTLGKMEEFCRNSQALSAAEMPQVQGLRPGPGMPSRGMDPFLRNPAEIIAVIAAPSDEFELKIGAQGTQVEGVAVTFQSNIFQSLKMYLEIDPADQVGTALRLVKDVSQMEGGEPPLFLRGKVESTIKSASTGKEEVVTREAERFFWGRDGWNMILERKRTSTGLWTTWLLEIGISLPAIVVNGTPDPADKPERTPEIKADLDALLEFSTLWKTTAGEFEKKYVAGTGQIKQGDPMPQFEWLTTTKDRARFSRQMFVNAPATLTLFGGAVKPEEAVVEFVNGRAGRASISIYNRGDAGEMGRTEFQTLFKKVGQSLGVVLKVVPKRQMSAGAGAVKNISWMWTSPLGVALLEHNDYESTGFGGAEGKPEYLRLKLAAPDQADWTMGRMSMGVQRMALQKNVIKDPASGDVYISNVPMVDQGAKGYCVAASCQRMFEYMRIPCDQHEIAQLLDVDVESGANVEVMQKSLAKVDQKFGVTFKRLVDPENQSSYSRKRISEKQLFNLVKEHVDKGVPLLWGLEIGMVPEDPPLPGEGQISGGHMRMIIGYNQAKNQMLFTDSWGAGHEKKRMDMSNAKMVTLGVYSMSPRGF